MRLRDLWADPPNLLTHRELISLVEHLPHDAMTWQISLGKDAPRSPEWHRLTDIADQMDEAAYQRGGGKGRRPKSRPRPGIEEDNEWG